MNRPHAYRSPVGHLDGPGDVIDENPIRGSHCQYRDPDTGEWCDGSQHWVES